MGQGVKLTEIDGGFEFNGWYLYDAAYKSTPPKSWWWVHQDTYMVGARLIAWLYALWPTSGGYVASLGHSTDCCGKENAQCGA